MTRDTTFRRIAWRVGLLGTTLVALTLTVGALVVWYWVSHSHATDHLSDYHHASIRLCGQMKDELRRMGETVAHSPSATASRSRVSRASLFVLRSATAELSDIQERFGEDEFVRPLERALQAERSIGSADTLLLEPPEEVRRRLLHVLDRVEQIQRLHVATARLERQRADAADARRVLWLLAAGTALLGVALLGSFRYLGSIRQIVEERERAYRELGAAYEHRTEAQQEVLQTEKLRSLGVLAGGIAHDFNNLLVGIVGNASLVRESIQPGTKDHVRIDRAVRSARRASELCRQLLSYAGRGKLAVETLDLSRVIADVGPLLQVSIDKRVQLDYDLAEGLPCAEADAAQLGQVAMNLIMNASDAVAERESRVTVTTGRTFCDEAYLAGAFIGKELPPGEYVFLEVADAGCGISAADLPRIFDPFFTSKSTGRGLGLAATLGIVRGHRAALAIQSEVGVGTTIRVLFPAVERLAPASTPVPASGVVAPRNGTVLVVDDDATVREFASDVLQESGLKVLTAADGRECIETYRRSGADIDAVLLDVSLPEMSGSAVLRELIRIDANVCVILSSGYPEDVAADEVGDQQFAAFLSKPYSSHELLSKVVDACPALVG